MVNFRQILEYLSGSVQICTDSRRNFFQTSIERRVYLVQDFLINKYLNFKLYLRKVKFRQILEYLSGSVQICTDSRRNFFQTSIERRVYLVQDFLINKYLNFKLYLRKVKFRQILENLSGSVRLCTDSQGELNMG